MTEPPGQEDGDMGLTSKVRRLSDISTRENMGCASCPRHRASRHAYRRHTRVASSLAILPKQIWYNDDDINGRAFASCVNACFLLPGASYDGFHCAHFRSAR
jgi:hypothetical protein